MSLSRLVERLRLTAPALDATGLAEALWLAASAPPGPEADPDLARDDPSVAAPDTGDPSSPSPPDRLARQGRTTPDTTASDGARSEVRDFAPAGPATETGRRIGMQPAPALPHALELARSLRPFKRQWPAGRRHRLDVEATVRAYARTRRLVPVFRRAPERWFDLALVIDDSRSMAVWDQTVAEFESVLHQIGAFRHIRSWRMSIEHHKVTLRDARDQPVGPAQLLTPDRRRLVLIVTDGLSAFWGSPVVWQEIWRWAGSLPTALVNPLATRLWGHTAIRRPAVIATPTVLGAANPSLMFTLPVNLAGQGWLALPTMTLSAHSMGQWARTTIRNDPRGCDAVLVPANGFVERDPVAAEAIGPDEALSAVQHTVSAQAFQLAILCSPFHRMTLQLLNLIRTELTPSAPVSAIAELVVTGVIRIDAVRGGRAQLQLNEDLRPLLRQRLTDHDAWSAYDTLTNYVSRHAGQHGTHSVGIPDPQGDSQIPAGMLPFADASRDLLRLFYGDTLTREAEPAVESVASQTPFTFTVRLVFALEDTVWAEWIAHVLTACGARIVNPLYEPEPAPSTDEVDTTVVVMSRFSDHGVLLSPTAVIYVDETFPPRARPDASIGGWPQASIGGLAAHRAALRIQELMQRQHGASLVEPPAGGPRFPGDESLVFNVPPRNLRFTGRQEDLRLMRQSLPRSHAMPLVLHGMGGVGKTQLAAEYAFLFRAAYDVVWWIDCDVPSDVEGSMIDLGARLGLALETAREPVHEVLRHLAQSGMRWLLILDHAEVPEDVDAVLRNSQSGHLLVTSRNPAWVDRAKPLEVDVFQRAESVEHLRQRVPSIRIEDASQIADLLGDLPIAVASAAAWLYDTGTMPEEYIRLLLAQGPAMVLQGTGPSVERTWDLSLNRLSERSRVAYRLLQLCSVLAPEISLEIVYSPEFAEILKPYDPTVVEPMVRGSLVQQLNRLALARIDQRAHAEGGGLLLVHRVLQHVVRSRMTDDELAEARRQVQQVLAACRPDGEVDDPSSWQRFRQLWPHLDAAGAVDSDDDGVRRLFIDRVRYQWIQGDLDAGQARAEQVITRWSVQNERATTDEGRARILQLQFNLANILRDRGLFKESRALNETVLRGQRELLPEDHPHTLMTAGGLAGDLRGLGKYYEALELDKDTFQSWLDGYGADHPRTLVALNNLAASYRLAGDFRQAREMDEQVYRIRRVVLGETHFLTLASAGNLARDLRDAGEYERSATLLRATWRSYVDSHGPSAKGALLTQSNLAVSLRSAGQVEEALEQHEEVYERLVDRFGPTNPDTLNCRLSRSLSMLTTDQYEPAARELRELAAAYSRALGEAHPHTLACAYNLSIAERVTGNLAPAIVWADQAAIGLLGALGSDHPYTMSALMNRAICDAVTGEPVRASEALRDTLSHMLAVLGRLHPNTLRCEANLALVASRLGEPGAEDLIDQVVAHLEQAVGIKHPLVEALRQRQFLNRVIDPHPF